MEKLWTSARLREEFLMYFENKGHKRFASSSLTNSGDPSVLLTTAGMQQFKPYYLDAKKADEELKSRRMTTSQKCFRTTDIDEVGDETHNTFFEMLGNFAFGDYFKKDAIAFAYELLTRRYQLKPKDLQVTIFEGDEQVPEDKESKAIWKDLGVPEGNIKGSGREDNFWGPTGDKGPCGPTTEVYVNGVEIWNIVFNEFYFDGTRDELLSGNSEKKLEKLSQQGVDTGMGLERLAITMQNVSSLFETDLFVPLFKVLSKYTPEKSLPDEVVTKARRIVADHMRGGTFLMAEGLNPSNLKAGYVLRRILRRAIRFGHTISLPYDVYAKIVDTTGRIYKDVYPELRDNRQQILQIFEKEYTVFGKTLKKGITIFEKSISKIGNKPFSGKEAFFLYSTYGFPKELIEEMLKERGLALEQKGFDEALQAHREASKKQS
jgi:alanyl-tRNA synthetase